MVIRKHLLVGIIVLVGSPMLSLAGRAQTAPPAPFGQAGATGKSADGTTSEEKAAPAPLRDLTGIWQSNGIDQYGYRGGTQAFGAWSMPSDGKPEHQPPYTPAGLQAYHANKPSFGVDAVPVSSVNDPLFGCEPRGMPRQDLYELGAVQIVQTPQQMIVLYTRGGIWRVIPSDGRELPKNPDSSWYGTSVGKWEDDTTFVAETVGMDERTWIDNAGRPHSDQLRVIERFHRVNHDKMELTVIIDDPKYYTKPWVAMDRLPFDLRPPGTPMGQQHCSPSEIANYNKMVSDTVGK